MIYILHYSILCETETVEQTPAITKRGRMSDEGASSVRVAIDVSCDKLMTEKVSTHLWLYP